MSVAAVIPCLKPDRRLIELVESLSTSPLAQIVVVDDGSGPSYGHVFDAVAVLPRVTVLRHAVNLGKGAALRTGFNHALCAHDGLTGVVTADCDGQHSPPDILAVAGDLMSHPGSLVLGVRRFTGAVPLRSRIGNRLTSMAVRYLVGKKLADTQTGLRGIPASLLARLLRMTSPGYEFELDVLIACKHLGIDIVEHPIATIYLDENRSSHFNPLVDSLRIYFALLRFSAVSLVTALLDNAVFFIAFAATARIGASQLAGRSVALAFNYTAVRQTVFHSSESHRRILPRYLALIVASTFLSYSLITLLNMRYGFPVIQAKFLVETLLFFGNFAVQREFVFTRRRRGGPAATDWDAYYRNPFPASRFTRRYTARQLVRVMRQFAPNKSAPVITEFGGANSCFLETVLDAVQPREYHIVDNNAFGLNLLTEKAASDPRIHLHCENVLAPAIPLPRTDITYSVGLIEHFDPVGTRRALQQHTDALERGGIAIIAYPTPTLLYRLTRSAAEFVKAWRFPDERALKATEVRAAADGCELLFDKILWPLVLTQRLMVFRKK